MAAIESRMVEIVSAGGAFAHRELSTGEARELFAEQPYKLELIDEIDAAGDPISTYTIGDFEDLCRGPHVRSAADIDPDAVRLLRVSWRLLAR